MSSKEKSVTKGKGKIANQVEVIKADELKALNDAAVGMYTGRQKYVTMLYSVMVSSPATISAHANYLADMDEKQGGGRSGALLKTLRANLRYLKTAHNLAVTPTVRSLEKDGPLVLTKATDRPRTTGGATKAKGDGKVKDVTLQDICASISEICKGMKPETRVKVAEMVYRAAMGDTDETVQDDDDSEK